MTRRHVKLGLVGPALTGFVLVLAFIMLIIVGARVGIAQGERRTIQDEQATLATWSRLLFDPLYNLDMSTLNNTLDIFLADADTVHVAVRDEYGTIVSEATDVWAPDKQVSNELALLALARREVVYREIGAYLVLCGPISAGLQEIGTLTMAVDPTQEPMDVRGTYGAVFFISATIILLTILAITLFTRRAMTPIYALMAAAEGIGKGNLDTTIPIHGAQETVALGTAMERMRTELKGAYTNLQQQIAAQEDRAQQSRTVAEIARAATVELDMAVLLQRVVTLIGEHFELYDTSILLLDETGGWVVLRAASSPGGQRILREGLRLRLGESSIVGYVAKRGEPYVVSDVETDPIYLHHPELPHTRSELALPLRARGETLGVLDMQSDETHAFSNKDVSILQTLADQVALAISNARIFRRAQENIESAQKAYGEISYKAWSEMLQARPRLGYYCDADGVVPIAERSATDEDLPALNIPITVRGQVIGAVRAFKSAGAGDWTDEETTLMESLTEQLNVALESARLHQDTQRRAARERLVGEVTARMRESLDLDTVLQIAAREIGRSLELHDVTVHLEMDTARSG
jgi:GAF domain-containing protein/HAMP domain-containing protein